MKSNVCSQKKNLQWKELKKEHNKKKPIFKMNFRQVKSETINYSEVK